MPVGETAAVGAFPAKSIFFDELADIVSQMARDLRQIAD
jgi:hypothetical protein